MKQQSLTELERNNKTVMISHMVEVIIMTTFCVLQAVGRSSTWFYALVVALLGFIPVIAEFLFWKKDRETPMIKHLAAIGFAIFYTYTLFTSTNNLVFVFVVPMLIVVSVYNDTRYITLINIGIVLESIILVILGVRTGKFGYAGSDSAINQIVVITLIAFYSYFTTKTLRENTRQRVQHVKDSQNETEQVLYNISELSHTMKSGIEDVYDKLEQLNNSSKTTKDTMQKVASGAADTAEAVQNQLSQTQEIQNKVDIVDHAVSQITNNMQQTLKVLENGSRDVELLVQKVDTSVTNSENAAMKLKTLDRYIEEMHSIVSLIENITSQTSLLALNASIEAARAGESGKGFSVVATEISNMATQTNDATLHITELISNVSAAINEVVTVIYQMIAGINEEKLSTENTSASFDTIQSNTFAIRDNITNLVHSIEDLKKANHVIVESIQTISTVSEALSVHAGETMNAEEENVFILENISNKMNELIETINK